MKIINTLFFNLVFLLTFSQNENNYFIQERQEDFYKSVDTSKNESRKAYTSFINKRLENRKEFFIQQISDLITKDSLFECIPNLKTYIQICERNSFYHSERALYALRYFIQNDDNFIIEDFKNHLKSENNKHSGQPISWLSSYIYAFGESKMDTNGLVENAFFDWHGINSDFVKFPILFEVKKDLEMKYRQNFSEKLIAEGFQLLKVIAYIDNTKEVSKGEQPKVRYIVQVSFPKNESFSMDNKFRDLKEKAVKAMNEIDLPKENIFFVFGNEYMTFEKKEKRFSHFTLIEPTLEYLKIKPNVDLENLIKFLYENKYFNENDYDYYLISEYLKK